MSDMKLRECPFCGGDAGKSIGMRTDNTVFTYVECESCAATADTVDAWNRRHCEERLVDRSKEIAHTMASDPVKFVKLLWPNIELTDSQVHVIKALWDVDTVFRLDPSKFKGWSMRPGVYGEPDYPQGVKNQIDDAKDKGWDEPPKSTPLEDFKEMRRRMEERTSPLKATLQQVLDSHEGATDGDEGKDDGCEPTIVGA